jgi:hypothetical protein
VWGASTKFLVDPWRKSASSLTYIYPLLTGLDISERYARKLLFDLKENKPKYIIETNRFCFSEGQCKNKSPAILLPVVDYIKLNYSFERKINNEVNILRRITN